MGVISLLGEEQAKHISKLIAERLDENEREERRIICGNAYAFQGDERDVMFLSMVVGNNNNFRALVMEADRQRFNVATSRARDQVFLFHSIRLGDIQNPECVRYKLLSWYLNPPLKRIEAGLEVLRTKADSQFEIDVGEIIIRRGYRVIPQFEPLKDRQYRIDLVVQGQKGRLAVECDGAIGHGPDRWEYDQRRETQLRRVGWNFWRVCSSAFYRNREMALSSLWEQLDDLGIAPENLWTQTEPALAPIVPVEPIIKLAKTEQPPEPEHAESLSVSISAETPDRLEASLAFARNKFQDIRSIALAEIEHRIVWLLKQGQDLNRENMDSKVCKAIGLHLSSKNKEMLRRKVERALQHLGDRELVEIDESGKIRFAFGNHSTRQGDLPFNLE